jgi:hypothetical protein
MACRNNNLLYIHADTGLHLKVLTWKIPSKCINLTICESQTLSNNIVLLKTRSLKKLKTRLLVLKKVNYVFTQKQF